MKKISLLLAVALFAFSCSSEPLALDAETQSVANSALSAKAGSTTKAPSSASTSNFTDYTISVSVSPDGSEWTYTINKAKSSAKTLSHFIISLDNCGDKSATLADVVWAKVNGVPTNLSNIEGSGTSCDPTTNNFIKFPTFSSATSWTLVIKFDRGYETFATSNVWLKAGTSCNSGSIPAPGCPKEEYCSFSQGYFFANGADNNGSSTFWTSGLTIGGINYTQTQGMNFWSIDHGKGGDQTMNAFFQLGAVRLSGVESEVAADAAIIDAYFNGINVSTNIITVTPTNGQSYKYFNLPASVVTNPITNIIITKDMVINAGGRIGEYIDKHHCSGDTYTAN